MAISKTDKDWCFSTAVNMAFKAAESGGMDKGIEISNTIEHVYKTLIKLTEETKSGS